MKRAVHVCHLTTLDDLHESPVSQRRDLSLVLDALRRAGRFSVWDMDDKHIRNSICTLESQGRIRFVDPKLAEFPWTSVEVVE